LRNHNFRASYQTGFRIPTTQNQYIDLNTPQARLLGGLPLFRDRYNLESNQVFTQQSVAAFGGSILAGNPNPALLQPYQFKEFKPEKVQSYEVGYKGLLGNKLFIDGYYYYSIINNFVGDLILIQDKQEPFSPIDLLSGTGTNRNVYQMPVNREEKIRSQGWALGTNYALPANFIIGANVSYNTLTNQGDLKGFQTGYNTPRYRTNVTLANREVVKNIGFSLAWRYQESFLWQSTFVNNQVQVPSNVPQYHTFDAQVSYKIPFLKSIIKLGGSNIFNRYYTQAWGNPSIGGLYYISLTFDELLN
jgi:outer membrane receptor protein involved in Fe transport